jgi:hypothetical protein
MTKTAMTTESIAGAHSSFGHSGSTRHSDFVIWNSVGIRASPFALQSGFWFRISGFPSDFPVPIHP